MAGLGMRGGFYPLVWAAALLAAPALAAAADESRLIEAVRSRNVTAVSAMLKQGANVAAAEADGGTALHWAAHLGDARMVDLLLKAGAPVNAANDYGVTSLMLACVNRDAALVERLLDAGADPNRAQASGETALMTCARTGEARALKLLVAHGARLEATDLVLGQTALMWAVANGHPDTVRVLIEGGADIHARTRTVPFRISRGRDTVNAGRGLQVEHLLPKGSSTPLLFAARVGDVASARLLVDAGANVNDTAADGTSVLVMAVHSGHRAMAQYLVERGADVNAARAGYTALHAAILRGDRVLVRALVDRGAEIDARLMNGTEQRRFSPRYAFDEAWVGATPYLLAAKFADAETMRLLAAKGADTKAVSRDGMTALMWAAGVDWEPGVKGTGQPTDRRGRTVPLELLTQELDERPTLEAVKLALELGGDVNQTNRAGDTALHGAARNDFKSVVAFLVEQGGKMDAKNQRGRTPADLLAAER